MKIRYDVGRTYYEWSNTGWEMYLRINGELTHHSEIGAPFSATPTWYLGGIRIAWGEYED